MGFSTASPSTTSRQSSARIPRLPPLLRTKNYPAEIPPGPVNPPLRRHQITPKKWDIFEAQKWDIFEAH